MSIVGRHSSFYDPFAEGNVVEGGSDIFPNAEVLSPLHIDAPPPYSDTLKCVLNIVSAKAAVRLPKNSKANDSFPLTYNARTNLGIHGQGTVIANCTGPISLLFSFSTDDQSKSSLYAQITETSVEFWYGPTAPQGSTGYLPPDRIVIQGDVVKKSPSGTTTFLHPEMPYPARYWLSIDRKNGILRFGRDYANLGFALYAASLKKKVDPGVWHWIDDKVRVTTLLVEELPAWVDHLTVRLHRRPYHRQRSADGKQAHGGEPDICVWHALTDIPSLYCSLLCSLYPSRCPSSRSCHPSSCRASPSRSTRLPWAVPQCRRT